MIITAEWIFPSAVLLIYCNTILCMDEPWYTEEGKMLLIRGGFHEGF